MYELIHKLNRLKSPPTTLLGNIYTNIQITMDCCNSGIIASNINNLFVFDVFYNMKINQCKKIFQKQDIVQRKTKKKLLQFRKKRKKRKTLDIQNNAQDPFPLIYNIFKVIFNM